MLKRIAAGFLWYSMVWVGYEIAWSVTGIPRLIGPILAASIAMIVFVDPLRLFWPRPASARTLVGAALPNLDPTVANSR